jgi:hypothetical protein
MTSEDPPKHVERYEVKAKPVDFRDGAHAATDCDDGSDVEPEDKDVSGGPDGNLSGGE